ncbi:MAG: histidinol dehydrogenase, partial [Ornithinimicrobium sp.]
MPITYLKRAQGTEPADISATTRIVQEMLQRIEAQGESATRDYSRQLDSWDPESFVLSEEQIATAQRSLPTSVKEDLDFAHR